MPDDLDVVFISTYTQASALAYALAQLYRLDGARTVIGGPHAKSFPDDCRRFFDVVVLDCDKTLVDDILGQAPNGETVTSGRQLKDLPTVEERMPELQTSIFSGGKPYISSTVPMLASIGCPYACDFCIDWSNPFALLPLDRLEADLRFIFEKHPKLLVSFHDPNFAVKFDEVFSVLERIPHGKRSYYIMESSLSILRASRLEQLRSTGCLYVAPGVESWSAYSNKSGVGSKQADHVKLNQVVDHFRLIREYVPGMQANLMFGLDGDEGDGPAELTKEFMSRAFCVADYQYPHSIRWHSSVRPVPRRGAYPDLDAVRLLLRASHRHHAQELRSDHLLRASRRYVFAHGISAGRHEAVDNHAGVSAPRAPRPSLPGGMAHPERIQTHSARDED